MITVEEALERVLARARPRPAETIPVADALGLVLAEEVTSDVDSPPHDKSIVDGYAVVAADLAAGEARLEVLEEVVAGAVPTRQVAPGQATRLMTGAPLPPGADAVVMVENAQVLPRPDGGVERVLLRASQVRPGQNIMRRGTSLRRGQAVLGPGHLLRAVEIGLLCEVGRVEVQAVPRSTVAVLPTGNELVPPVDLPAAGQIRNSNGPMLLAAARRVGAEPVDLGVGRDDPGELRRLIQQGLAADVLVLSGGVSAGVLDLVPRVLAELGVEQVFHKVRLKPGKPLWFGVASVQGLDKLVFGLPGNPVSSLVCFELFVRPAIERLAGRQKLGQKRTTARLATSHVHRGERPTYHPARLKPGPDGDEVEPLAWHGSADLLGLAEADALVCFPAGDRTHEAGSRLDVYLLE
jgi:molybdopterin molybdotransferase